jgi:putative redox protein
MHTSATFVGGMAFETRLDGHTFLMDASPEHGGSDRGPRPKGLVLAALAGCTGVDVVSILEKMRVAFTRFEVEVDGEVASEHPKRITEVTVRYRFEGTDLPVDKLARAIALSEERYCGVSATLRPAVTLTSELWINGARVPMPAA